MSRSAVFLDEMGIGPQWRLRNAAPAMFDEDAEADGLDADAIVYAGEAAGAPAAEAVAAAPKAAATAPAALANELAPVAASPARTPSAGQPPAAANADEDSTAWFDEAPAVPPPAAGARPQAAAQAPGAPQRPPAGMSAPAAPAQQRAAAQPPAARPPAAHPAADGIGDESTAWFDDVPAGMVPVARAAPPAPFDDNAVRGPVSAEAIANMDWSALRAAVQTCTRCELCETRKAAVPGRGDAHAQWLVLATAPNEEDESQQRPVSAEPGQLLDNMLKAISLAPEEDAYVTTLVKCRPPADRPPNPDELSSCRPYLQRELELAGTRAILTLGHTAGKGLLGAAARGKVLRHDGIPTVATYHPADLLRKPEDKARAWADLCLAKAAHAGRA
ncbi:uracil-DNA glycosylase [Pseudoduganella namucuonensis]|uniref:Type-4 uracil-DNA glycosylase n=1 Tax=Pseudoduganella namucuonensis TaxID=1035707 RepID=A0A1I7M4T4_9BURK|nr:uracil-DNA glycosylase [Pseudoduganella namucuonensis]SFV16903.1 DNA polymerase [Pseudoduganella namucuonensis]